MSDESLSDSDIDLIDLNSDEEGQAIHGDHDFGTPVPQEIILGVNGQGSPIPHMVDGPERADSMDIDNAEVENDEPHEPVVNNEESLFVNDDGCDSDSDNGPPGPPGPPSPPSSDGSDDEPDDPDSDGEDSNGESDGDNDGSEDSGPDSGVAPIQPNQIGVNMGNPGGDDDPGDDPDDDGSEEGVDPDQDDDPINDPDVEGDELHGHKNLHADVSLCLEEENVNVPEFYGNCIETCHPQWWRLAQKLREIRNLFLRERQILAHCKSQNRARVTDLNRTISALNEQNLACIEVVQAFYAANRENAMINQDLHEENEALRLLVSQEDLDNFPDSVPLPLHDMEASVPQQTQELLPANIQDHVRVFQHAPRKTERVCTSLYMTFTTSGFLTCYRDGQRSIDGGSDMADALVTGIGEMFINSRAPRRTCHRLSVKGSHPTHTRN
jgi:hypothetical protein